MWPYGIIDKFRAFCLICKASGSRWSDLATIALRAGSRDGLVEGGLTMRYRSGVALLAIVVLAGMAMEAVSGEFVQRRKAMDPPRFNTANGYPGAASDPAPLPGPRPYWGQALGSTYYNWGYFGARHQRAQFISHAGYYGEYFQFGYARGY